MQTSQLNSIRRGTGQFVKLIVNDSMVSKNSTVEELRTMGNIVITNNSITGVQLPVLPQDAANKQYVDESFRNFSWKTPVRRATTEGEVITFGSLSVPATGSFDGMDISDPSLTYDTRLLVKNNTLLYGANPVTNGIYLVKISGIIKYLVRSEDMADGSSCSGAVTFVEDGVENGDKAWLCINNIPNDIVGTDPLIFVIFTGGGSFAGGSNTNIQFNLDGLLTGNDSFTYNYTTYTMEIGSEGATATIRTPDGTSGGNLAIITGSGISDQGTLTMNSSSMNIVTGGISISITGNEVISSNSLIIETARDISLTSGNDTIGYDIVLTSGDGTAGKGGDITLHSGSGTTVAGNVNIDGEFINITGTNANITGETLISGNVVITKGLKVEGNIDLNVTNVSSAIIYNNSSNTALAGTENFLFINTLNTVVIGQETGRAIITAKDATTADTDGCELVIRGGSKTGTGANGNVIIQTSGKNLTVSGNTIFTATDENLVLKTLGTGNVEITTSDILMNTSGNVLTISGNTVSMQTNEDLTLSTTGTGQLFLHSANRVAINCDVLIEGNLKVERNIDLNVTNVSSAIIYNNSSNTALAGTENFLFINTLNTVVIGQETGRAIITAKDATTADTDGCELVIRGGSKTGTGRYGNVIVQTSGKNLTVSGNTISSEDDNWVKLKAGDGTDGGHVYISSGTGTNSNGRIYLNTATVGYNINGDTITSTDDIRMNTAAGKTIVLTATNAPGTNVGGNVNIIAGAGATTGAGGGVTLTAGDAAGATIGGNIVLRAGASGSGTGGSVKLIAANGNGTNDGKIYLNTTTVGYNINGDTITSTDDIRMNTAANCQIVLTATNAVGGADGGNVTLTAGAGHTNGNGGSITISPGVKAGGGSDGWVSLSKSAGGVRYRDVDIGTTITCNLAAVTANLVTYSPIPFTNEANVYDPNNAFNTYDANGLQVTKTGLYSVTLFVERTNAYTGSVDIAIQRRQAGGGVPATMPYFSRIENMQVNASKFFSISGTGYLAVNERIYPSVSMPSEVASTLSSNCKMVVCRLPIPL